MVRTLTPISADTTPVQPQPEVISESETEAHLTHEHQSENENISGLYFTPTDRILDLLTLLIIRRFCISQHQRDYGCGIRVHGWCTAAVSRTRYASDFVHID